MKKGLPASFLTSAKALADCPADGLPEFAFIGRSNVGKSSLINMLTSKKGLATVSSTPGRTRLLNFFNINANRPWRLVDLPGYGYAKVSAKQRHEFHDLVSDYLTSREELTCVVQLVDSRLTPQKIDLEFSQWLMDSEIPFILVFTKTDKSKSGKVSANITAFTDAMSEWCEGLPRIFTCSSKTGSGRTPLLEFIDQCLEVS
ncbi:ribosome biogenesis GTP-binding protein YihA/YsxC [Sulfuriroseicoccus oceanibius]|uniref:Probable GTP-binding protein EngB n=1 Tax=Sulfuriroseicoccus oceanibius TaxID=2707525 RepID=A0A6B3LBM7_9BACT|nr:ribosome biogenesis GTP-binding protein YihA/YsxC [Sulfuriroseicoccus oceanibius]QQL44538.1 YihA family ribosome biogenesis GTP-binding protein [Sulfuriroseicoccus oceanibius]